MKISIKTELGNFTIKRDHIYDYRLDVEGDHVRVTVFRYLPLQKCGDGPPVFMTSAKTAAVGHTFGKALLAQIEAAK